MRVFRQICRGCMYLPHVGSHPGTGWLFIFLIMGAMSGAKAGLAAALGGFALVAVFMAPIYLYGAYDRANFSDQLQADQHEVRK